MKATILPRKYEATDVQQSYSRVVGFYNLWSWLTERKATRRAMQIAQLQDGEAVLEVAVGTGIVFEEIVKQNPNGRNEGIELSAHMLSKTLNRLQGYHDSQFQLQVGSTYNLPFASASFDLIVKNLFEY